MNEFQAAQARHACAERIESEAGTIQDQINLIFEALASGDLSQVQAVWPKISAALDDYRRAKGKTDDNHA